MKKTRRIGLISIITLILMFVVSMSVFAAKTVTILDGKITIADSTGNGSGNATKYTASVTGGLSSAKSTTITIKNETENDGEISFDYSVSGSSAFSFNGNTATSGSYSGTLKSKNSITITMTAPKGLFKTAKLTITNVTFVEASDSAKVTYEFDSTLGSLTANGNAISNGDTITIGNTGAEIIATPKSGCIFVGWVDANDNIISTASTYTQLAMGNKTIRALFSKNTPYFLVDKKYIISDLNTAVSKGAEVVLMCNGTLPAGNYTIPSGVILSIPMDSSNTIYTTQPGYREMPDNVYTAGKLYRKFTLSNGVNITVNGAMSVAGKISSSQGSQGSLVDTYGQMVMNSGSTITVNNGAKLYAWGFITGSGSITAKSGSTVYEPFQVRDWRGGSMITEYMIDNDYGVFPFSQYYVQNIEVPLTLEAGAIENGFMALYVSVFGNQTSEVPFIGPSGMFNITNGYAIKDYDENTDRLIIDVSGKIQMKSLELSMRIYIGQSTIKSENYTLPVNSNITLNIRNGSEINVSQDMALLPGGQIHVDKGAKCIFAAGTKAFIYASAEWGGYCSQRNLKLMPAHLAPGRRYTRKESDLTDAIICVAGEVDASAEGAFVYTTKSGANIYGVEGGIVKVKQGPDTVTYQVIQGGTDSKHAESWPEIPVTTAYLKNGNGSYVDPEVLGNCCTSYIYTNGVWTPNTIAHTKEETVAGTPATCTASGLSDGKKCTACGTVIQEQTTIPSTGHTYGDWEVDGDNHKKTCVHGDDVVTEGHTWDGGVETTPATHKASGVKTYTCSACKHTKTEVIPQIPHSFGNWQKDDANNHKKTCSCGDVITEAHKWNDGVITTAATCTQDGVKTYTCTVCSETYTEAILSTGHSHGDWEKNNADTHKKVCACGDVITEAHAWDGGVETQAPTHTVDGVKTYTCTVCNETREEAVSALGHSHGEWEKADDDNHKKTCSCGNVITEPHAWDDGVETTPATHKEEGVKTYTCSVCNHTKTEVIEKIPHSYGEWEVDGDNHKKTCSCGDVITEAHDWDAGVVTTQPSHKEEGERTYTCSVCNHTKTEVIEKVPHSYGEWIPNGDENHKKVCLCGDFVTDVHKWDEGVVTQEATHFADGVKTFTCSDCKHTRTEVIEQIPHAYGGWEKNDADTHKKVCSCGDIILDAHAWDGGVETLAPTHTVDGVKTYTCTVCNETYTEAIKAEGHSTTYVAEVLATCTEAGTKEHYICSGCDVKFANAEATEVITDLVIPSLGHSHGAWEKDDAENHKKVCFCGDVVTEAHAWDEGVITTEATHFAEGLKTYTCTACGETKTEVVEQIAHSHGGWEKNDADTHKKVCSCGDIITEAHAWDGGVETLAPTHTQKGVKTFTCTVCNETRTEAIDETPDHEWDEGVITQEATHFADGVKTYTCICGETYTEVIPKIAHAHGGWEKDNAENHKKVCECGDIIREPHDWNDGEVTLDPTETEDGVMTYTCTECGETYTVTIPATGTGGSTTGGSTTGGSTSGDDEIGDSCETGHSWDEVVTEATHYKDGFTTYTCSVCGETYTEVIPKIPHEFGEWTIDKYNHNSVCECGYILMKAHDWDEGVITYPAECDQPGVMTYTCTVCNHTKTENIPVLGHTYGEWQMNEKNHIKECSCGHIIREKHEWDITEDATCSEGGTRTYTCTVCEYEKSEEIPATGHAFGAWEFDGESHKRECECGETEIVTHIGDGYDCALCNDDKVVTQTSHIIEDGQIKLNSKLALDVPAGIQIIVALYNADGKMLYASVTEASVLGEMAFDSSEVAKIRIFTWSGFNSMSPITAPEEIIITSAL